MAKISLSSAAKLCRRVGTSLEAGLDARTIWSSETRRAIGVSKSAYETVEKRVTDGSSLAEALRAADGYFPPLMCEMVETGEYSGRLGNVFHQLADHYENLVKLRRSFLQGISWPLFELIASIFIIGGLILILGIISDMHGGQGIDPFGMGLGTFGNMTLYCFMVFVAAAIVITPIVALARGWLGSAPIRIAHRIPLLGTTIQVLSLSRMAWSLGMAIDAGMDAIKSMRLSLMATQNPLYMEQVQPISDSISQGHEMHVALQSTEVFPTDFVTTLENGELTGQVTESMARLSSEYRAKAEHLFRAISMIGGVLVMMMVFAVIITAIFALFSIYLGTLNEAAGLS